MCVTENLSRDQAQVWELHLLAVLVEALVTNDECLLVC